MSWTLHTVASAALVVGASALASERATEHVDAATTLRSIAPDSDRVVLPALALDDGAVVDLELTRCRLVTERTRFVLGADSAPIEWDSDRVRVYRGTVAGDPSARAFVTVTPTGARGYVDGIDGRRWIGSTTPRRGRAMPAGLPPGVHRCGSDCLDHGHRPAGPPAEVRTAASGLVVPAVSTRVVELAVETDHEFYTLFEENDPQVVIDYVVELYAAVSDIFERDVNARLELTFVRVWDTPDDLFNEPDPLFPFRDYWNAFMGETPRDVAQFLSGRRDLPYGGIAWLGSLCGPFGYSVVGYTLGFFPDVDAPSIYHFDVPITAHELGHNFDANHTHSYGLDNCLQLNNTPQRGTIMSYCSQTVSGGNANTDLRFHTFVQDQMKAYLLNEVFCADLDCNGNGVEDSVEIAEGLADDANLDGVPDDCQDCDQNGILDPQEIAGGDAADVNGNGIPDRCEPDCNRNGIPDDHDIATGHSLDVWADGIPDECEADCDADGTSDYSQIQANLGLDVNRNTLLDSCEDCDGDGVTDLDALDGAWDAWVTSSNVGQVIRRFNALTGVVAGTTAPGMTVNEGRDVIITPDRRILVAIGGDSSVAEFAADGSLVGLLVGPGSGGLQQPSGIAIGPDGALYVTSRGTDEVLRYDLESGAFLGAFVEAGAGGLTQPFGLTWGPDGLLYVSGGDHTVRRYTSGGGSLGLFVNPLQSGGLLDPRGLVFRPDGNLVVASHDTNSLLEYDGETGSFTRQFNQGGTSTALTFDGPWCVRIGPNGNLFASRHHVHPEDGEGGGLLHGDIAGLHINSSRLYEFDVDSGVFIRSYVTGNDTGLYMPTGFDFMPDTAGVDCNVNGVPDVCEIAEGLLPDVNGNGIADDCEAGNPADLDGDGVVDGADLGILLGAWGPCGEPCVADLNGDGTVDGADLGALLGAWG